MRLVAVRSPKARKPDRAPPGYGAAGSGNPGSLVPQFYNDQPNASTANMVKLTAGTIITNIDAAMHPGGTLSGVVTDQGGHRLSGVCVGAAAPAQAQVLDVFSGIAFTRGGRYSIEDLTPGAFDLNFSCSGSRWGGQWFKARPDAEAADLIAVNPGVTTTVNAKVRPAGSISGTVTGPAGQPLDSICVEALNAARLAASPEFEPATRRSGHYKFAGLAAGRYFVQFQDCSDNPSLGSQLYKGKLTFKSATPVMATGGRTTTGINARMSPGGTISGVVKTPVGKPAAGVCVDAFDEASSSFGFGVTGTAGGYTIHALATGLYLLQFEPARDKWRAWRWRTSRYWCG